MSKSIINFYLDDSGTRHPDHDPGGPKHGRDWFALGGVLVRDEDKDAVRSAMQQFRAKWPQIEGPLHSVDIRHRSKGFRWLVELSAEEQKAFYDALTALMLELPVVGLACVIDRPGYNSRYREKYGRRRWSLCRTAFIVSVERAAKYAMANKAVLRVHPERASKTDDAALKRYYDELREKGHPFDEINAAGYKPLSAADYERVLYDFKPKKKSSALAQIADMYLWPMCMGGYHKSNRAYKALVDAGKLIDCRCGADSIREQGIKYSCFDHVKVTP